MIVSSVDENCLPIEQRIERELTWKNHLREFTTKRLRVKGSSTDSTTRVRQPRISSPSTAFLSRASNPGNFCLQHERLPSTQDPHPLSRNLCPPYFEELGLTLVRADSTTASSGVAPAASAPAATGLENRGEWSGYVAFAAGPSGVLRWSPAGREVREKETYSIQTHVYERQDE